MDDPSGKETPGKHAVIAIFGGIFLALGLATAAARYVVDEMKTAPRVVPPASASASASAAPGADP